MSEAVAAFIYFGGVVAVAAFIVHLGVSGRWSKDDWPAFALLAPWFWPLFILLIPFAVFVENIWEPWWWQGESPRWNPKDWTW